MLSHLVIRNWFFENCMGIIKNYCSPIIFPTIHNILIIYIKEPTSKFSLFSARFCVKYNYIDLWLNVYYNYYLFYIFIYKFYYRSHVHLSVNGKYYIESFSINRTYLFIVYIRLINHDYKNHYTCNLNYYVSQCNTNLEREKEGRSKDFCKFKLCRL